MELEQLGWLYEISGISITIYDRKSLHTVHKPVFDSAFAEHCMQDFILQRRDEQHPLVLMLDPGYFIGIAQLREDKFAIFGPAAPYKVEREKLYDYCKLLLAPEVMLTFCEELLHTPLYSYRKFSQLIALALKILMPHDARPINLEYIVLSNSSLDLGGASEQHLSKSAFYARENEIYHTSADWENELFLAVEHGDIERMKQIALGGMRGEAGNMSLNPLMQERYVFVVSVTQATRAAVRGGLSQETAYSLSDMYCQRMDALGGAQDISILMFKMLEDFCKRVEAVRSLPRYTPAIQKCCQYIDAHLHKPISLQDLADCCGLSRRSVSIKFKKETGCALPDYIHAERIKEAKYLLKNTDYTIADICSFLQYNSQSYFTKVFRQTTGATPLQFREGS